MSDTAAAVSPSWSDVVAELPLDRLPTPALLVDAGRMRHNVDAVLSLVDGDALRWRPHLKTTKTPDLWAHLLERGLRRFKCATTREAALLLALADERRVETDLLLAYPLIGPGLARVADLAAAHPRQRLSVLCEHPEAATAVPETVGIYVEVDPGMHRTGVDPDDTGMLRRLAEAAGPRLRGVHAYDGHVRDADRAARRREAWACNDRGLAAVQALREAGLPARELVTTGTPTLPDALAHPRWRSAGSDDLDWQVSPGTVVLSDLTTTTLLPELDLRPAAVVLTRVVSRPGRGRITCDAGSKAISTDAGHPCCAIDGHPELEPLVPTEEHLPIRVAGGAAAPDRGAVLALVPRHVCTTVNLAEGGLLVGDGPARVVPVAARAHDVSV